MAQLATELPQYASKANDLVASASAELAKLGVGPDQIKAAAGSLDIGKLAGVLGDLLGSVAGLATNFVFLLALLLFLCVESGGAGDRLASIAAERPRVTEALGHFAWGTRQYLLVTTVFGLIVAVLDSVALAIMGIPLAVTWGLLSFITNYIPNVGFIIGVIPPALLGLLTGGPALAVAVVVVYCTLNFIVQSIIQPRFIGDAVGLSITVTFVALVFWAWLLGALGAILAIPLTLLCKALLVDIDPQARWADALLRSTPKEPEAAAADAAAKAAAKAERKKARRGAAARPPARPTRPIRPTRPDRPPARPRIRPATARRGRSPAAEHYTPCHEYRGAAAGPDDGDPPHHRRGAASRSSRPATRSACWWPTSWQVPRSASPSERSWW